MYENNCSHLPAIFTAGPVVPFSFALPSRKRRKIRNSGFGFFCYYLMSTTLPAFPLLLSHHPIAPSPLPPKKKEKQGRLKIAINRQAIADIWTKIYRNLPRVVFYPPYFLADLGHMTKMFITPIYGKTLQNLLLKNQCADCNKNWYVA